jgi:hypothetical protein
VGQLVEPLIVALLVIVLCALQYYRLRRSSGAPPDRQALARAYLRVALVLLLGSGFLWALYLLILFQSR